MKGKSSSSLGQKYTSAGSCTEDDLPLTQWSPPDKTIADLISFPLRISGVGEEGGVGWEGAN